MPTTSARPDPGTLPLTGLTVVSVAINLPGPLAVSRLAALGASVTKVEPPTGDPLATVTPQWYEELTGSQTVMTLDLKSPEGQASLAELVEGADLLVSSLRPSAARRLGLPTLAERAGVVLLEIIGHAGEQADRPGHDLTYQAAAGTLDGQRMPLIPVADLLGSERALSEALAALYARKDDDGRWVHLQVALEDAAEAAAAPLRHGLTGPGSALGGTMPSYAVYPTADGHLAVGALEPHFAQRLAEHIGATREELTSAFATRTGAEWERLGEELDLPLTALRTAGAGQRPGQPTLTTT